MQIFLVGASATGKTTLAKQLAERFGLKLVKSKTEKIRAKFGGAEGMRNPKTRARFQARLLVANSEALIGLVRSGERFVCDRSIDAIAYTNMECDSDEIMKQERNGSFRRLVDLMGRYSRKEKILVVYVRPCEELRLAALAERGPVSYIEPKYVEGIDELIGRYLRHFGIRFKEIPGTVPGIARIDAVLQIIQKAGI